MSRTVLLILTLSLCAASVALFKLAAGARGQVVRWALAALVALILALGVAVTALGGGFGTTAVVLVFSLTGLLTVFSSAERRGDRKPDNAREPRVAEPETRQGKRWRGWVRGLSALLLATITANALGAGLAGIAPGSPSDRFAVGLLVVPLLWAGFAIWVVSDRVLSRPLVGMAGTLVGSAAMIAWSMLA